MDSKLLTESGWRTKASEFKIRDGANLQRALSGYEKLPEDKYAERLKAISSVCALAEKLATVKEVAARQEVVDYLEDVVSAAEEEQRDISKSKSLAEKTAKAEALAQKKEEAEEKKREETEGKYEARLMAAFQKLKSGGDVSYEFIVCDAKPYCGLMVAKRITSQHKEELTRMTGGSKRFLVPGTCRFEDGKFAFAMDRPVTGLARKLQDSIKYFTGKKLPVTVGTESVGDDDGPLVA